MGGFLCVRDPLVVQRLGFLVAVNRCVCRNISFRRLLELHVSEGMSLDQIMDQTGCCTGCTTGEPYVRLTLMTGETDHPVLTPREIGQISQHHAAG